ncbi:unnamed protein product [Dovyalis caffra]|uniref:Uncharacterized protein n=1 Tax=Dovyalis caffra TaxID=77055 RepID=A0AAV1S977_9ROSI|nr:unnamed protein product [Dovyalis caffra]
MGSSGNRKSTIEKLYTLLVDKFEVLDLMGPMTLSPHYTGTTTSEIRNAQIVNPQKYQYGCLEVIPVEHLNSKLKVTNHRLGD